MMEAADTLRVERVVHSLKPVAALFGAATIADLAQQIETHAAEGRIADIHPLVDRLKAEVPAARRRLQRALAEFDLDSLRLPGKDS